MTIEHRDALIYMLTEASELEHSIMCQYLFASFSLKSSTDEGIDGRQLRHIEKWRKLVVGVAIEEMLHFALVNNLLISIGAAPKVGRPNLPQSGRYYPPGVTLALVPFGERALRHFLYLERPEGISIEDAEGFEAVREAEPLMSEREIVPRPQHFHSVGELYRAIEEGFENLAAYHGEEWLFCGPVEAQATPESFMMGDLIAVTDLATAKAALNTIVEQGEGPRGSWRDAHYGRFLEILGEFLTLKREDPSFEPARPVVPVYVRAPLDAEHSDLVSDPATARVLDVFNVAYEVLLYTLARFFAHGGETEEQLSTLAGVAIDLMARVLGPTGRLVTTMPAGPDHPGKTAGPSFEIFYRSGYMLPHARSAWVLLHERLLELYGFTMQTFTEGGPAQLADVADALLDIARRLSDQMDGLSSRKIRVPPAWSLGAVPPDETDDPTAESPSE
jgi:hypothetical protein